jgi:hypothetical protein
MLTGRPPFMRRRCTAEGWSRARNLGHAKSDEVSLDKVWTTLTADKEASSS